MGCKVGADTMHYTPPHLPAKPFLNCFCLNKKFTQTPSTLQSNTILSSPGQLLLLNNYLISFWSRTRFTEIKDHFSSVCHSCSPGNCLPLHLQLCNNTVMFSINLRLKFVSCRPLQFNMLCTKNKSIEAFHQWLVSFRHTCSLLITGNVIWHWIYSQSSTCYTLSEQWNRMKQYLQ